MLKNATYGTLDDQKLKIIEQLKEQHGYFEEYDSESRSCSNSNLERIDESQENEYSFAETPAPEPEASACSIDADQLLGGLENNAMMMKPLADLSRRSIGMNDSQQIIDDHQIVLNISRGSF